MTHTVVRERRWIILGEDGGHVTIGRHTDPSEDELARAKESPRTTSQGGWLAILEGRYYGTREAVSLMMVRELVPARRPWELAVDAFRAARQRALATDQHNG